MNTDTIKKGISGLALVGTLTGGYMVIDKTTVTDREIRDSIEESIAQGAIPQIDLRQVSLERMVKGYVDVAESYGIDTSVITSKPENLYQKIRTKKIEDGQEVVPMSNQTIIVQ